MIELMFFVIFKSKQYCVSINKMNLNLSEILWIVAENKSGLILITRGVTDVEKAIFTKVRQSKLNMVGAKASQRSLKFRASCGEQKRSPT